MLSIIDEQIKLITKADLSNYNSADNTYIIPKRTDIKLVEDKSYLIELIDKIPYRYMKIYILSIDNNLINVSGIICNDIGINTKTIWQGFLDINNIKIISEIK